MLDSKRTTATDTQTTKEERKTVELCGDARAGRRCIRPHGHEGKHECHTPLTVYNWE